MKNLFLLSLLFIATFSKAQSTKTLQELNEIYAAQVMWEDPGELKFSEEEKAIFVKSYRIPVSVDTQLKYDKKKGNTVIFSLQNNTAITDINDPDFKRAGK
jgi:hypothetical protein